MSARHALRRRRARRQTLPAPHSVTGDIRVHRGFESRILGRSRDILVWLPPGYAEQHAHYPVLYVHDGQNLFDGATAYVPGEEWQLDETAGRLVAAGEIEPLIIVGINHAAEKRLDEFTPTRDARRHHGGHADQYGRMLVEELKPFIDGEYRTVPDAEATGLGGSSLGGLATMYLGVRHADVFRRLAVMSPSAWWDRRVISRVVRHLPVRLPLRVWLDIGTEEGDHAVRDVRALRGALLAKGWEEGEDLAYHEIPGGTHSEAAWRDRVGDVLRFLYPSF